MLTINSRRAYGLAEKIKKVDMGALVVLGGIHPTVLTDATLRQPGVDVVVRGEGEETFTELVELVLSGKDYTRINGISYKKGGNIVHNPDRSMIRNLDDIPSFPYHLFENIMDKYPSFGCIFTS